MCRALCCATWLSRFNSVSTAAARFQNLAQNSLKLTGQCGKLKCCTNYEVDVYMEAKKAFPSSRIPLETESGTYYFNKCDLLAGEITYSLAPKSLEEPETISVERAKEIIEMNQRGEIPETLYLYVRYNSCYAYTALPLTIELRSALGWRATTSVTLALAEELGV